MGHYGANFPQIFDIKIKQAVVDQEAGDNRAMSIMRNLH